MSAQVDPVEVGALLLLAVEPGDRALAGWNPPQRSYLLKWDENERPTSEPDTGYIAKMLTEGGGGY